MKRAKPRTPPRRASPSDARRARAVERTRQDILEAAARVFAGRGYHAATMQLVAREAGFTAASLYTYFPGKESIYAALVGAFAARIMAVFEQPEPQGLSFPQRLELLLQRQLQLLAAESDALRLMFDLGPPQLRHAADASPRRYLERLGRFLAEAGRGELRVAPAEAALLLHGLGHGLVLGWLVDRVPLEPVAMAARTVDLFLHGVTPR